ncbi:zinc finger and SCAN domain-containing protein 2-like isoform X2 [Dunckerocampus dactyliophorus]|uniref:zinc finger and SCAN domain-containing protein 2-like isoform X2 n=1 Tax=Dunckerocampus dactyliophorus TaxID=161453 RepID=UPI00240773D6|nr:zinc finger and SCAN domain-containing protein 2-like isoform X2 [Dunckerocampus dactyliophorus]
MDMEDVRPAESFHEEEQEWSSRVDQEESQPALVKDEEEEHSISQEDPEELEEFPVISVIVKGEDDEDKGQREEKKGVESPSSSSTRRMTTETDGDHCGGSQALAPLSDSDDTTSHSPDTDDEEDSKTCHTDNTHFKCSQCDKTFVNKRNLKRHMRSHTGRLKTTMDEASVSKYLEAENEIQMYVHLEFCSLIISLMTAMKEQLYKKHLARKYGNKF